MTRATNGNVKAILDQNKAMADLVRAKEEFGKACAVVLARGGGPVFTDPEVAKARAVMDHARDVFASMTRDD